MSRGATASCSSPHCIIIGLFFLLQNAFYELGQQWKAHSAVGVLVLEVWHYVLVGFVLYESFQREEEYEPSELIYCFMCNAVVLKSSYHCWRCNQCSHLLDHHCKYLNCCIGFDNYLPFLRLLAVYIMYSADYLFLLWLRNTVFTPLLWGLFVATCIGSALSTGLLGFHVYLAWCFNGSTLSYYSQKESKTKPVELQEETHVFAQ